MKKIIFILSAVLVIAGCSRELQDKNVKDIELVLNAGFADEKTSLDKDGTSLVPKWSVNDKIGVYCSSVSGDPTVLTNMAGAVKVASFQGTLSASAGPATLYGFYPSSAFNQVEKGGNVSMALPSSQYPDGESFDPSADILVAAPYAVEIPAGGSLTLNDVRFARVMAVTAVVLKDVTSKTILKGQPIRKVVMTSSSNDFAGNVVIDLTDGSITSWTSTSKSVSANYSDDSFTISDDRKVIFVTAPVTLETGSTLSFSIETENYQIDKAITLTSPIELIQAGHNFNRINLSLGDANITRIIKDTHPVGYKFFTEDFNWIADYYTSTAYSKYGWPADKQGTDKWNEYALSADAATKKAFIDKGYDVDAANTYVKYEGWVRLGKAASTGMLKLPALSGIDAGTAVDLLLTFDTADYYALVNSPDPNCRIKVIINGSGEISASGTVGATISQDKKMVVIPVDSDLAHRFRYTTKQVLIKGAMQDTRIQFDDSEAVKARAFLDNVVIEKASATASPAADFIAEYPALDVHLSTTSYANRDAAGVSHTPEVRINRPWRAESTVGWITIDGAQILDPSKKYDATASTASCTTLASDGCALDEIGSFLPFKLKFTVAANIASSKRAGQINIKDLSTGQVVATISITQKAGSGDTKKIDETLVYKSADGKHIYYRIPALIQAPNGNLLAFCEARNTQTYSEAQSYDFYTGHESDFGGITPDNLSGSGDRGNIDLVMAVSNDLGSTWKPFSTLVDDKRNTCGNPVPVVDEDGTIHLFFNWGSWPITSGYNSTLVPVRPGDKSKDTRRIFYMKSTDNGSTWTTPVDMTSTLKNSAWGWVACGPGHGLCLKSGTYKGRLIIPVTYKKDAEASSSDCYATIFYSDDKGATWKVGGSTGIGANESLVAALPDNKIIMGSREAPSGSKRLVAISSDGGASWGTLANTGIQDPSCQGSIINYNTDGIPTANLMISNPVASSRKNVSISVSTDGGSSWTAEKQVVTSKKSAYSDICITSDGSVAIIYETENQYAVAPYESIKFQRWPKSLVNSTFGF